MQRQRDEGGREGGREGRWLRVLRRGPVVVYSEIQAVWSLRRIDRVAIVVLLLLLSLALLMIRAKALRVRGRERRKR